MIADGELSMVVLLLTPLPTSLPNSCIQRGHQNSLESLVRRPLMLLDGMPG